MNRRLRHSLAMTLALAAASGMGGCLHAGHGGHSGYGGYTRGASSYSSGSCYRGYRVSGGAEEFLAYTVFYGGFVLVAGVIELLSECWS